MGRIEGFRDNFRPKSLPYDLVCNPFSRILCGATVNTLQLREEFLKVYQLPMNEIQRILVTAQQHQQ